MLLKAKKFSKKKGKSVSQMFEDWIVNSLTKKNAPGQKRAQTTELIRKLLLKVDLASANKIAVQNALNSDFKDIEDAILYFVAYSHPSIDCFVTFNTKDFIYSDPKLPVYAPLEVPGIKL